MKAITDKTYILEKNNEFTPEIGRLVAMMEYTRNSTIRAIEKLSVKELDYQIDNQGNSIGCLLQHISDVEEVYQIVTFEDRNPTEQELDKINLGLLLRENAQREIKGHEAHFYVEQLKAVRIHTLSEFSIRKDEWLDELFPFGQKHLTNNYFRWFHVFEDELTHLGQIRMLLSVMKRTKG